MVKLSSVGLIDEAQAAVAGWQEAQPASAASEVELFEDVVGPSSAVILGRLNNSELLSELDECFPHFSEDEVSFIKSHVSIFRCGDSDPCAST